VTQTKLQDQGSSQIRGKLVRFHFQIPFRRFNPDARPFPSFLSLISTSLEGQGHGLVGLRARDKDKRRDVADRWSATDKELLSSDWYSYQRDKDNWLLGVSTSVVSGRRSRRKRKKSHPQNTGCRRLIMTFLGSVFHGSPDSRNRIHYSIKTSFPSNHFRLPYSSSSVAQSEVPIPVHVGALL
jgi:hypothetical protein